MCHKKGDVQSSSESRGRKEEGISKGIQQLIEGVDSAGLA